MHDGIGRSIDWNDNFFAFKHEESHREQILGAEDKFKTTIIVLLGLGQPAPAQHDGAAARRCAQQHQAPHDDQHLPRAGFILRLL